MKGGFLFLVVCAITIAVAVSKDDKKESDPSATFSNARQFGMDTATPSMTTHHPNTTTTTHHPNTTTTTHHPNTTTTTHHPNTTTTTHHPNTTTTTHHPNTTTTTHHPNTTTHHPNTTTTTHHPNTTTHHFNTTTAHPKTTTHHPITTTAHPTTPPKPTPKANLTVGDYALKCALVSMELQIKVEYDVKKKYEGIYILQAGKSTVQGKCENSSVNLNITFKEGFIDFRFQKNNTEKSVYVSSVAVELTYPFEHADPKKKYAAGNSSVQLFRAAVGHSYSCRSQSVYLGKGVHLEITKGRMQAFNTTKSFGPADPCPADQPDYRVAIAVGIVLLILIIIVVVAYIIGRRKRTDGYQSL